MSNVHDKEQLEVRSVDEATNDYARSRVPLNKRRSLFSLSMVLVGFCISMAGLYTGAALLGGLNIKEAIIAGLIGNVILTVYAGMVGVIGAREGVSTTLLIRHSFGVLGSKIISIIFALTLVGWYGYQCGFFGNTFYAMFPNFGIISNPIVAGIWGGILMMTTAIWGFKSLAWLSNIAAPAIFIMSGVGLWIAASAIGGWEGMLAIPTEGQITIGLAITMVVGAFAVGGVIQPDITRYAKNTKDAILSTAIGYIIAHSFVIIAGFAMSLVSGEADVAFAMLATIGASSLVVLILAQWTTNQNNLYSSSLAFSNILPVSKNKIVIVAGLIATVLGAFGLVNYLTPWLVFLGTAIPPVAGIMVADYFIFSKRKYNFGVGTVYKQISIEAFIAWIIAIIIGFTVQWGISSINSLVVGFVMYYLLKVLLNALKVNGDIGKCVEINDGLTKKLNVTEIKNNIVG